MPKKEALEGITINGKPLKVYVEEQQRTEIEKVQHREVMEKGVGLGYTGATGRFGNISRARSQFSTMCRELSRETIEHLNYLQRSQGEKAVTEYLNKPTVPDGSIESAVKDAKEKIRFYAKQQAQAQQEVARWEAIERQLSGALDLLSGRAPTVATSEGKPRKARSAGRDWPTILGSLMGAAHFTRVELEHKIADAYPELAETTPYGIINTGLDRGYLVEENGKFKHAK